MKIIAYGGWYGSGNIGDDAILIGIRNIFRKVRPEIGIVALSLANKFSM
jgi:polysaccharide pyruvyl transferase WcaK-like protein